MTLVFGVAPFGDFPVQQAGGIVAGEIVVGELWRSGVARIHAPESVTTVQAGTVVDATYMNVEVPSIRPPVFPVAEGCTLKPLNALFQLQREVTQPSRFAVIGAGSVVRRVLAMAGAFGMRTVALNRAGSSKTAVDLGIDSLHP